MFTEYSVGESSTNFMYKVYGWMAAALTITALTAYAVVGTSIANAIFTSKWMFFGLVLVQLALVIVLNLLIEKMSLPLAATAYVAYAVLTGIIFSSLIYVYTQESLTATFAITAGMFGVMALYGYFTKADLTSAGNIAFMGLIGIIIASLVNYFLQSSTFNLIISGIGVIVFCALTAYDIQKIKMLSSSMLGEGQLKSKVAIVCALALYLDFINLFLMLLQFTGKKRE